MQSVAIIGSFRKHYKEICDLIKMFEANGIYVNSPACSRVVDSVDDFVIFESDNKELTPSDIQMETFEKILKIEFCICV